MKTDRRVFDRVVTLTEKIVQVRAELAAAEQELDGYLSKSGNGKPIPARSSSASGTKPNGRHGSVSQQVRKLLARGAMEPKTILAELKLKPTAVRSALANGRKSGEFKVTDGKYELVEKK